MVAAIQISHLQKSVRTDAELGGGGGCKTEKGLRVIGAF